MSKIFQKSLYKYLSKNMFKNLNFSKLIQCSVVIINYVPTLFIFSSYIKTIDDYDEQLSYLTEMLDQTDSNHLNFIQEFSKKVKSSNKISALAPPGMVAYKKKEDVEHGGARPKSSKGIATKNDTNNFTEQNKASKDNKKGSKFVPLFSKDGKVQCFSLIGVSIYIYS